MKPNYQIKDVKCFNVDCMDFMKDVDDNYYDLAIVDPPYGLNTNKTGILNFRMKETEKKWNTAPKKEYFNELFRISKHQIIWGGNYFPYIWSLGGRCFVYWHKGNPVPNFADGELAWTSFNKNAKQCDLRYYGNIEGKTSASKKHHPTQKPIQLYKWLLENYAKQGNKIIDTHGGSMSLACACLDMGFDLDIMEIDKEYFDNAVNRLKNNVQEYLEF